MVLYCQTASSPARSPPQSTERKGRKGSPQIHHHHHPHYHAHVRTFKFQENACLIDVSFWQFVIQQKLNIWKLRCPPLPIRANLEAAPSPTAKPIMRLDANCIQTSPNTTRIGTGSDCLSRDETGSAASYCESSNWQRRFEISGTFYHVNTLPDLMAFPFSQCVADTLSSTLELINTQERSQKSTLNQNATDVHIRGRHHARAFRGGGTGESSHRSGSVMADLNSVGCGTADRNHMPLERRSFSVRRPSDQLPSMAKSSDSPLSYVQPPVYEQRPRKFNWEQISRQFLNSFFIVAYMDLKRYIVMYAISCPTLGFKSIAFHQQYINSPILHHPILEVSRDTRSYDDSSSYPKCHLSPQVEAKSLLNPRVTSLNQPSKTSCKFTCEEPSKSVAKEFMASELIHIGKHLLDLCYCHNDNLDRQSTGRVCLVIRHKKTRGLSFVSLSSISIQILDLFRSSHSTVYISLIDFSRTNNSCSWPVRNLLFCICIGASLYDLPVRVLAFRDFHSSLLQSSSNGSSKDLSYSLPAFAGNHHVIQSRIFTIRTPSAEAFANRLLLAGWLSHRGQDTQLKGLDTNKLPLPSEALFTLNLQSFLDHKVVQQNATELNVKLIKWRILPSFRPHTIQQLRFLLIGMGTLGCHIARDLVGWGALKLTLLDCAAVAPSNPARQSLYLARDVENALVTPSSGLPLRGRSKVQIAKERLLEVRGDLEIDTIELEIPMPNQERFLLPVKEFLGTTDMPSPIEVSELNETQTYAAFMHDRLRELIESHDCVLLLTDSRESRWLPALIVQSLSFAKHLASQQNLQQSLQDRTKVWPEQKRLTVHQRLLNPFSPPICLTVALGFDTFVVIRHGTYADMPLPPDVDLPEEHKSDVNEKADQDSVCQSRGIFMKCDTFRARLSCYFCNDLSAPSSVGSRHRTLDQQCTVTRTGIAGFASAIAVETLTSLSQAPYGFGAMPSDRRAEMAKKLEGNVNKWPPELIHKIRQGCVDDLNHISCLGDCPHVTRGSVASFSIRSDWHPAFDICVCCSEAVQQAYLNEGSAFIEGVVRDSSRLEDISGLSKFRQVTDARGRLVRASESDKLTDVDVLFLSDDDNSSTNEAPESTESAESAETHPASSVQTHQVLNEPVDL